MINRLFYRKKFVIHAHKKWKRQVRGLNYVHVHVHVASRAQRPVQKASIRTTSTNHPYTSGSRKVDLVYMYMYVRMYMYLSKLFIERVNLLLVRL